MEFNSTPQFLQRTLLKSVGERRSEMGTLKFFIAFYIHERTDVASVASGPTGTDACTGLESRLITAVWMNDTR